MDANIPEIWKPIPGFERYDVSNTGKIWDNQKIHYVHLIIPKDKKHYVSCNVDIPNFKNSVALHRLVIWAFTGRLSTRRMQVNHKDGNKLNNNLYNLELVTVNENVRHAYRTGLNTGKWKRKYG